MLDYEACMAMVMVAAILLMVLAMKMTTTMMMLSMMSNMIRLSTHVAVQNLEQHNIMSSTTGATARRKIKNNTQEPQERRMRAARP